MQETDLRRAIRAGQGKEPADLVLKDVRLLDVISGIVTATDIAIVGDRIVGTHAQYQGRTEIDCAGRFAVPGFIDTHLHIESSLITPFEFDRCVLPHGVTTAICDPHEIANVLGADGIAYFLSCSERTVMDIRANLSSCVPATNLETAGAKLEIDALLPFLGHPKVIGLAEMMNFPGVLSEDPGIIAKLAAFRGGISTGTRRCFLARRSTDIWPPGSGRTTRRQARRRRAKSWPREWRSSSAKDRSPRI
jgi:adenine deaminase